jgi:hypothetical protein
MPYLGVGELGEKRDDVVHEVLVVDDAVLALLHQNGHKLAEICPELLPELACMTIKYDFQLMI